MNSHKKLAEKIIKGLKEDGYLSVADAKKFIELKRDEGKEVIWHLINLSEEISTKRKLYEIHSQNHYRYDPRLEILMVWLALDPSIQKSFNPKDIV